jgi:Xaa-Pro aminopeptidase
MIAAADYENAKKRNARDKEDFNKISQERNLKDLIPVLDNFERAVGHANTASANASAYEDLRANLKTVISGVERVRWLSELPAVLHMLLCQSERVFLNSNEHERAAIDVDPRDLRLARELMARYPLHRYERLAPLLRRLRAVKDEAEIDLIRQAIDITDAGLRRLVAALKPGVTEYELEAELASEFTRRRARMAYEPIIGSGKNACVLHYLDNMAECRAGELVLVDVVPRRREGEPSPRGAKPVARIERARRRVAVAHVEAQPRATVPPGAKRGLFQQRVAHAGVVGRAELVQ